MKSKLKTIFKYEADMKRLFLIIIALMALLCFHAAAEGGLRIVATDFPCYDFARQVAGEYAEVTMLLKPGTEAHAYDPTPADILSIGEADLFVYIGGESDAWADSILSGLGGECPQTLRMMDCVADLVEEDDGESHHHDDGGPEYDEHIWTSPVNAAAMVKAMSDALAQIDPGNAGAYAASADAYTGQIMAIDGEIRGIVDGASRKTLVFADRFPFIYFTREYGLDHMAAFNSCTADTEPSAQIVMSLIDKVASEQIPVVYTIEMSTQAVARTISEETGAKILTLHSMQTVTQDEFDAGENWVSLMEKNAQALREGLQ